MRVSAFEDQASANVTTYANTVNVRTKILRFLCPDGMRYTLLSGGVFTIKLYDSTPTEIKSIGRLWISVKIPSQDAVIEIAEFAYQPFSALTVAQQQDVNNQALLQVIIPKGKVTIKEVEAIYIELNSATLVSWAGTKTSRIEFEMIPEAAP